MAIGFHVHGPCYVQTGTAPGGAIETLGITVAGAVIRVRSYRVPIQSDAAGGVDGPPADYQSLGAEARVEFDLVSWDSAVLGRVQQMALASGVDGEVGSPGSILGAGGYSHSLYLPSTTDDPWYFPTVTLLDPHQLTVGARHGKKTLAFHAWVLVGPTDTSAAGKVLYTRSAPG